MTPCNQMTCGGCCQLGMCYSMQPNDLFCGYMGNACQACVVPQHCITIAGPPHCG
jgi:hypothetical protein